MKSRYYDTSLDYLKRIRENDNILSFIRSRKVRDVFNDVDLDILNSLSEGNSIKTVCIEFNIDYKAEYKIWDILHSLLNIYARSGYDGSLSSLDLSKRAFNALLRYDFYSINDIKSYISSGNSLGNIRNVGKKTLREITLVIGEYEVNVSKSIKELEDAKSKDEAISVLLDVLKENGEYDLVNKYLELYV